MNQAKMEFKKRCIMDKMIIPDNDDWISELLKQKKSKRALDKIKTMPHNADI